MGLGSETAITDLTLKSLKVLVYIKAPISATAYQRSMVALHIDPNSSYTLNTYGPIFA